MLSDLKPTLNHGSDLLVIVARAAWETRPQVVDFDLAAWQLFSTQTAARAESLNSAHPIRWPYPTALHLGSGTGMFSSRSLKHMYACRRYSQYERPFCVTFADSPTLVSNRMRADDSCHILYCIAARLFGRDQSCATKTAGRRGGGMYSLLRGYVLDAQKTNKQLRIHSPGTGSDF